MQGSFGQWARRVTVIPSLMLSGCDEAEKKEAIDAEMATEAECVLGADSVSLGVFTGRDNLKHLSLPSGDYCIELINGPQGSERAASAEVSINETELWSESSFNKNWGGGIRSIHLEKDSIEISVNVKSGPKKGLEHSVELRISKPQGVQTNLTLVPPSGKEFSVGGVNFSFSPGALVQEAIFSVDCQPIIDGLGPRCEIVPHAEFIPGSVKITFPLAQENFPTNVRSEHIRGYHNGETVAALLDSKPSLTVFPPSFSSIEPGIDQWYELPVDPPLGLYEPKDYESDVNNSYSDKYGINIGLTKSGLISVKPGYIDPDNHSKGFREGWKASGYVSLCRKRPGENGYTKVASGHYKEGDPVLNFGPKHISEGKNFFFVILFSDGNNPAGCQDTKPLPPLYRTADLTVTRYTEEWLNEAIPGAPGDITYWRHHTLLSYIHERIVTDANANVTKSVNCLLTGHPTQWGSECYIGNDADPFFTAKIVTWQQFFAGGAWDYKGPIRDDALEPYLANGSDYTCDGLRYPVPGTNVEMYYDIWSNIHFGYVGRAMGFSEDVLQAGAASFLPGAGKNDPVDVVSVKIGTRLFELYPPESGKLSPQAIHKEILNFFPEMLGAQATEEYLSTRSINECGKLSLHFIPIDDGV